MHFLQVARILIDIRLSSADSEQQKVMETQIKWTSLTHTIPKFSAQIYMAICHRDMHSHFYGHSHFLISAWRNDKPKDRNMAKNWNRNWNTAAIARLVTRASIYPHYNAHKYKLNSCTDRNMCGSCSIYIDIPLAHTHTHCEGYCVVDSLEK